MAEVALGFVGAAASGIPQAGFTALTGFQVGVLIGSVLFPPAGPKIDQGRLDEIRIQNSQQGSPIPIYYGRNRGAGTIIWASGLIERRKTSGGGKGGGGPETTEYSYSTSLAVAVAEGPISKVRRIWANEKVIYDWRTGPSPTIADYIDTAKVRIYDGTQTLPDAAIEADKGAGEVPAFKGLAYVVFEELNLSQLGNQIPNFTFEIEPAFSDVEEVMNDLAARCGLEPSDYDFSALAGIPTRGLVVAARTEAGRVMETLAIANRFDVIESGGVLKAVLRGGAPALVIPSDDIGASADETPAAYVESERTQELELPREFTVTYQSEASDFQSWTQTARRNARFSEEQENITLPMAPTDSYARYLADSLLLERWAAREVHSFSLPPKYLAIDPGDVLTVQTEGRTLNVRITSLTIGLLAQIEVKAVSDDPAIYADPGLPATASESGNATIVNSSPAELSVAEVNAPYDEYAAAPNLFMVAGRNALGWYGGQAQVFPSLPKSGGSSTGTLAEFTSSCTFGETVSGSLGVLADYEGGGGIDRVSIVRVTLAGGELQSVAEDEMITQNKNLAIIGGELVNFATATFITGTTYELSNFIRYRRGTEGETHASGEGFALVDDYSKAFAYASYAIGSTVTGFRLIENGRDYSAGLPSYTGGFKLEGTSRKPYSPVHLKYSGDRSGGPADVAITWVRRARTGGEMVDFSDIALDETAEAYEIEIWNAAKSSRLRLATSSTPAFTYTAAMQSADGVSAAAFAVRVFQISQAAGVGRGRASAWLEVGTGPYLGPLS